MAEVTTVLIVLHLLELLANCGASVTSPQIQLPPIIVNQPPMRLVVAPGEPVRLDCVALASGLEPLTYWWRLNGAPVGNVTKLSATDTNVGAPLFLASASPADQGDYQCFAANSLGTAVTVRTSFSLASLAPFPRVPRKPTLVKRNEGESLRLPCRPPASLPPATVLWHRIDDGAAGRMSTPPVSNRVAIDPSDGSLLFANLLPSDGDAVYQCGARNDIVRRTVEGAAYRLLVEPDDGYRLRLLRRRRPSAQLMSQSQPRPVLLTNQTSADLFCFFAGLPTPNISWTRADGSSLELASGELFRLLESNTRLQLLNARADKHSGGYRCVGEVDNVKTVTGNSSGSFEVSVASPPSWLEAPANVVVAEDESHSFACRTAASEGLPSWLVNGQPAELDGRARQVGQRLLFANLSRVDSLVVQCNSSNRYGYVFANAYLRVVWEPPVITQPPGHLVAPAGSDLRIPCRAFTAPKPTVAWTVDDRPLDSSRLEVQESGDLFIRGLETRDSGAYRCRVINKFGADTAVGQLTVRMATRITMPPPKQLQVAEGTPVRLDCRADTDPAERPRLTVSWLRDGRPLKAAAVRAPEPGQIELTIVSTAPADSGSYTCSADNGLDSDSRTTELLILGRPGAPPSAPRVDCSTRNTVTSASAQLTWPPAPENNSPIQRYTVEFATQYSSSGDWLPAEVLRDQSESVRESARVLLRPGLDYTFRVRGVNAVGAGQASEAVRAGAACRLAPTRPARHPGGLRVEAGSVAGCLAVSWEPLTPLEYGGDGLRYILRIQCLNCQATRADEVNETIVGDASKSRIELSELAWKDEIRSVETYRKYRVQIRAANTHGEAASSAPPEAVGRSGELPPTVSPSYLRMASTDWSAWSVARLSWSLDRDPSRDPRVRGFYRGFRAVWCTVAQLNVTAEGGNNGCLSPTRFQDFIYRVPSESGALADSAESSTEPRPVQFENHLTGLPGFANIRVWLHVLNLRHSGPPSQPLDFRTPEGTPGQVGEFVLSLTGASHLEFDWLPPREPNGRVVGYQLSYREVVGLPMGPLFAAPPINDPSQLRGSVAGLSPNTNYRVYIRARTAAGEGEAVFLDARTAPPNSAPVAAAASATSAAPVGSQALNVSVASPPARMRAFYVQYRPLADSGVPSADAWLETKHESRRRWLLIDSLKRGAMYEIRVVMLNGAASAVYTESLRVRTGDSEGDVIGLLKGSTTVWLGSAAMLLLLLLFTSALVFYCLARRRKRNGGRRGGEYHRGKPVPTSSVADDATPAASTMHDGNGDFVGTLLHCSPQQQQQQQQQLLFATQRLSPEGAKSYTFADTSYLTLGNCIADKPSVQLGSGGGYSTVRGPSTVMPEFSLAGVRQPPAAVLYQRQASPLMLTQWPPAPSNGVCGDALLPTGCNGGRATSII